MGKSSLLLLMCALKVISICKSETTLDRGTENSQITSEPLDKKFQSFVDGPPPLKVPISRIKCYENHMRCLKVTGSKKEQVCAHQKDYGLINFPVECDLKLENCLIESYEKDTGKKSTKEPFYYNGKGKDCHYYLKQTYTDEDAVKLYFIHGTVKENTRRNELPIE